MTSLLKISDAASLGLHAMLVIAGNAERLVPAKEIAGSYRISEAHLAKVFQRLAKVGLVKSTRGPHGGFELGRPADEITLMDIYEAIEGPIGGNGCCLFGTPLCGYGMCIFGGILQRTTRDFRDHLSRTRLSQFIKGATVTHGDA